MPERVYPTGLATVAPSALRPAVRKNAASKAARRVVLAAKKDFTTSLSLVW
jgi:hypothetical protein